MQSSVVIFRQIGEKMIETVFETLGFAREELKTYKTLLENGPQSGGRLSGILDMPRPTVYGYLNTLVSGGMVTQSLRKGVKIFSAEAPGKIRILYQRKMEALAQEQKSLDAIIPALEKQAAFRPFIPNMKFYEGQEGIQNLMEDMLQYKNLESYTIWPIQSMLDVITPEFLRYHNKMRIKRGISFKSIWQREQAEKLGKPEYLGTGKRYLREIRISPQSMNFSMGCWYYNNKAIFISSAAENFGFMIESSELLGLLKAQFEIIWNVSIPFSIEPKGANLFFEEIEKDKN